MRIVFVTACAMTLLGAMAGANAQMAGQGGCHSLVEQGICAYAAPLDDHREGPVARVSKVSGAVSVSAGAGYTPVTAQSTLGFGDRLLLLDGGQATLRAGGRFQTDLSAPSIVDVSAIDNCACIATRSEFRVLAQLAPQRDYRTPLLIGAGIAGLAAVIWMVQDGDDEDDRPVSP